MTQRPDSEFYKMAWHRLLESAEDASNAGLSLGAALEAVRAGYDSAEVDRAIAKGDA